MLFLVVNFFLIIKQHTNETIYINFHDFNIIIKSNPRKANTYVRRATAYYYLVHYDSALTDINHALHLDEKNSY